MRSEGVVLSFSFLLLWLPLCFEICLGGDTLKANQNITQDSKGNLVSSNHTFELGFFSPGGESGGKYLGIWYHGLKPQTVVWVANRDDPVADSSGVFRIAEDGNLVVEDASSKTLWSSELGASSSTNRTLKLLDSGNLVLIEDHSETRYVWESFRNPTDTFLPGMKMDASLSLTCWRDSANPAPGNFTFKLNQQAGKRSLVVQYHSQIHWASDELGTEETTQMVFNLLYNNDTRNTKTYKYFNKTFLVSHHYTYNKSRLLMKYSGEIVFLKWDEEESLWSKKWSSPEGGCDIYDCINWPHSTCKRTGEGGNRCHCDSNYSWNETLMRCTRATEEQSSGKLKLILLATLGSLATVTCIMAFGVIVWRKKKARNLDGASTRIQESLYENERHVKGLIGLGSLEEKDIEGIEVPFYTFASILAATDNFSDSNKLGRGGYGPVYKGTFPGGQEIAVKRLSSVSTQGLQEFKNEVILIAKLQHRNLVRLRGYCIKGDEKILLYEYMPNKSLDSFIFDRSRTILLDWPMRFEIIVGIARGMLYLHQDSRLRVIHRDMKTSNVLLDEEMNPKISDFGLAKIFGGKETEASTERVMGTYGYMAPEYALDGLFSVKSDVFSFGVVLLEILSGKRNTGFYESEQISSLLGYAWKLWSEKKLLDLMDPSLGETCNENQFFKCAVVGLLCIQDEPSDRPTMSNLLYMLDTETTSMPIPTQPTFFMNKRYSSLALCSSKPETSLQFDSSYDHGR